LCIWHYGRLVIVSGGDCQCPEENNADGIHKNTSRDEGKFRDPLEILGSLQIRVYDFLLQFLQNFMRMLLLEIYMLKYRYRQYSVFKVSKS